MAYVLIEHRVGDFETFRQVYLDDAERRERLGSRAASSSASPTTRTT